MTRLVGFGGILLGLASASLQEDVFTARGRESCLDRRVQSRTSAIRIVDGECGFEEGDSVLRRALFIAQGYSHEQESVHRPLGSSLRTLQLDLPTCVHSLHKGQTVLRNDTYNALHRRHLC